MLLNHFSRRGNALLLTTIILALVITGMLSLTDQLLGRKQLADFSRVTLRAQEAADNVAEALCDRINVNASLLTTDFASSGTGTNPLDNWLTRGFVRNSSDIALVRGIWLNNCVVYWRLEPVTAFDHTMTDTTGDGVIQSADVDTNNGVKYMTNRSLDIAAGATTGEHLAAPAPILPDLTNRLENSGLLFFEMTVDAFAMTEQNRMSANPLDAATNPASIRSNDRSPYHAQIKKRVMVNNVNLFRYVIFYSATGPAGDFELYGSPNVTVVGAVHTNGAAYIGTAASNDYKVIFGSFPVAEPGSAYPELKPVAVTAVKGLFCMRKNDMLSRDPPILDPMSLARGTQQGNDYQGSFAYINAAKLRYETINIAGLPPLAMPAFDSLAQPVAAQSGPFTMARDSRDASTGGDYGTGIPLNGYNSLVRDGKNRQLQVIDITRKLGMNGYRPLEPFSLVGPNVPLAGANGSFSISSTATGRYATDMMLFQRDRMNGGAQIVSPTQTPGLSALVVTGNQRPWTVSAFDPGASTPIPIPGAALVPPPISRTQNIQIDNEDIFSHLGTYIIESVPNPTVTPLPAKALPDMSPVPGTYIRNPLGLNAVQTPGVGIVILERGSQAGIAQWPSGSFVIHGGTAQGGSINQIVLALTASSVDDMYTRRTNGTQNFSCKISIISGPGKGQSAGVTQYVGASRTATIAPNWTVIPDNTSEYVITPGRPRLGQVSWDPPSVFSNGKVGEHYYDSDNDGIIDPDVFNSDGTLFPNRDRGAGPDFGPNGQMTAFLMDYCQWMRSNYVVYFGVNTAGDQLVDITDQFFSVPPRATGLDSLLAHEDVFKDRREARWRQSTANNYTSKGNDAAAGISNFDAVRVNTLTLNIQAINNFIQTTPLNRLDSSVPNTSTALASSRFNGTIYAARTPRYSNVGPGTVVGPVPAIPGCSLLDLNANMFTYRVSGSYDPMAPLGFNQTWSVNSYQQSTALPVPAQDTLSVGGSLLYPVVGSSTAATVNGYPNHANVAFGSVDSWSCYPLLKRVRVQNGGTIEWGGRRSNGRSIGLSIYTPNVCYLQGNFNVVPDSTRNFPACALYCDGLIALSNNWNDVIANNPATNAQFSGDATATVHRICLVIHNNPTDLGNIATPSNDVWSPSGSGGVHNVIKFLENWSTIEWAFIGSLVVLDRARYTRGYLGNQDVYNPPKRYYNFNEDLKIELPPFPDVINEVFIW